MTATSQQRRGRATEASQTSSFESPFGRSHESTPTLKIPSFKKYASSRGETPNKVFSYFMAGSMGLITAVGAKATVHGIVFVPFFSLSQYLA
jgi:ubiquinol-cytochrome c reductase iron-sulfur subunit